MSNVNNIKEIITIIAYLRSLMGPHIKLIYILEKSLPEVKTDYDKLNPENDIERSWIIVNGLKASGEKVNDTLKDLENTLKNILSIRMASDDQKN